MTSHEAFCFWLEGVFDTTYGPTPGGWELIKHKLAQVQQVQQVPGATVEELQHDIWPPANHYLGGRTGSHAAGHGG